MHLATGHDDRRAFSRTENGDCNDANVEQACCVRCAAYITYPYKSETWLSYSIRDSFPE
jgi:hypothetical protein